MKSSAASSLFNLRFSFHKLSLFINLIFMIYLTSLAITLLLTGIFISKEIIEVGQLLFFCVSLKCLYQSFKDKKMALPKSAYWMLAFIVIALISIWINSEIIPRPSINRAKLKYPLLGILGIFVFRYWFNETSDNLKKWVLNFFFVSVLVSSLCGIFIFFRDHQDRMYGIIHTSRQAYGSSFFIILIFSLLLYRDQFKNFLNSKLAVLTLIISFIAMALTYSRGPMLSLVCAIPIALYLYRKKIGYIIGASCLILILALSANYFFGTKDLNSRFLVTKEIHPESARKSIWQAALIAIEERPTWGLGYFNFKKHINRITTEHNLPDKSGLEHHAHNNFLEIASGTGLIGVFFFLGWFISWMIETLRPIWGRKLLTPFFIVFLVTGMVEVTIIDSHLATFVYLIYSFSSSFWNLDISTREEREN